MQQTNISGLTAMATLRNLRHPAGNRQNEKKPVPTPQKLPDHYLVIKAEKEDSKSG